MVRGLSAGLPPAGSGPGLRGVGLVAAGGAVGTLARYLLEELLGQVGGLPLGVFVINLTGALFLGVLIGGLARSVRPGPTRRHHELRLLLGTGLLGGYTTYSLLATDIAQLLLDGRIVVALGYGLATIMVGGVASWSGILITRTWRARRWADS